MVLGGVLPDTPLVYGFVILTATGFIWFGSGWLEAWHICSVARERGRFGLRRAVEARR